MAVNSCKGFVWKFSIKILYVHRHLTITQHDTTRTITLSLRCLYTLFFHTNIFYKNMRLKFAKV